MTECAYPECKVSSTYEDQPVQYITLTERRKKKSHDLLITKVEKKKKKSTLYNSAPFHDKNCNQTRHGRNLPLDNESHI